MLITLTLFIMILSFAHACIAQGKPVSANECGQEEVVLRPLAAEAENGKFLIRRVEISGNATIRHREFVNRLTGINEGDTFSIQALERAVRRIAKMKQIYPITMRDIELRLDGTSRDVDILVCVKERIRK